jgi:hypothetical protein
LYLRVRQNANMSQYFRATIAQAASCRACHSCGDRSSLLLPTATLLLLAALDARGLSKNCKNLSKKKEGGGAPKDASNH